MWSKFEEYDILLSEIRIKNRDLLTCFYITLSRMEYALKKAGFFKEIEHRIIADWERFANCFEEVWQDELNSKEELQKAAKYVFDNQPLKQTIIDGELIYVENSYTDETLKSILFISLRIKDNLFHGWEYPLTKLDDPAKEIELLENTLDVLKSCLKLDDIVYNHFIIQYEVYYPNTELLSWKQIKKQFAGYIVGLSDICPSKSNFASDSPFIGYAKVILISRSKQVFSKEINKLPIDTIDEWFHIPTIEDEKHAVMFR